MSWAERFWAKVNVTGSCWLWLGTRTVSGYGHFSRAGRPGSIIAHRVAYEMLVGPIPEGCEIDHLCRVRHCVNPDHLEAVPHLVNIRRGATATKTHCLHGHPLSGPNLYVRRNGTRCCKQCMLDRNRRRRRTEEGGE